jgi:SAM-dependent methyltransferase
MNFWDAKYKSAEYGYGIYPNQFFKQIIDKEKTGSLLLPGEGEGRNAIYAAKNGWHVSAFDTSIVAQQNALNLARKNNVIIEYSVGSVLDFKSFHKFDLISIIYLHLLPSERKYFHQTLNQYLHPNGKVLLEVFSKEQIHNNSGGPKNSDMLYSVEDLKEDFNNYNIEYLVQRTINLDEGDWHRGDASVIRLIATKKH